MATRHSEYARDDADWYSEPHWVTELLLDAMPHVTAFHDPCCGWGTIVAVGLQRGLRATGADIVDRTGLHGERDFLADPALYENIVSNPPYRLTVPIIEHALAHVRRGGVVAVFVPISFLASQRRASLHREHCIQVLVLSTRPSVPTGALLEARGESARHSGSVDYAWMIYRRESRAAHEHATVDWLSRTTPNPGDPSHA
jgi:hypothetical protein